MLFGFFYRALFNRDVLRQHAKMLNEVSVRYFLSAKGVIIFYLVLPAMNSKSENIPKKRRIPIMKHKDYVTEYLEFCQYRKELDWKTVKAYRIDLRQFFETVPDEPDKGEIERYITSLHKKYKQKTGKRKIASIKAFYNYLEEEGIIEDTPFRKIRVKFKETIVFPRIIPREEIEQLLNHMYQELADGKGKGEYGGLVKDLAVVELFFATGMRVYELSNIQVESINLNTWLIRIMGKGAKERYIQIGSKSVLQLLRKYYEANRVEIQGSPH